jgi:hypothetical protein
MDLSIGDLLLFSQAYLASRRYQITWSPAACAECAASEVMLLRSLNPGALSPEARALVEAMRETG